VTRVTLDSNIYVSLVTRDYAVRLRGLCTFQNPIIRGIMGHDIQRLRWRHPPRATLNDQEGIAQLNIRPAELLAQYTQRFLDDRLRNSNFNLAIETHLQQTHRPAAELERGSAPARLAQPCADREGGRFLGAVAPGMIFAWYSRREEAGVEMASVMVVERDGNDVQTASAS
jgi:hypothetical protein